MGSFSSQKRLRVDKICIVGAGPSGLAAAKYLIAERAFSKIVIFEQRSSVGGIWNYTPCLEGTPKDLSVPQTDPNAGHDQPMWRCNHAGTTMHNIHKTEAAFMTPLYDHLETNIPRGLMGFSDLDWPEHCQLFPQHAEVLKYVERYAESVKHIVEFETQVQDVHLENDGRWTVTTKKLSPDDLDKVEQMTFDAVVSANGHFNVPYIPSVDGIDAWQHAYPGTISHSKFYRTPEHYAGKKVIVVGNSASGTDISSHIATACQIPLLLSQKSESYLQPIASDSKLIKPEIVEYIIDGRKIRFADGSEEMDVDAIVYCTGYFYSFPFMKRLRPPVISSGEHVENLFQHIFYRPQPTLAFPVLNQKVIPFPMAEAQAAVIARVYSGRLQLPGEMEMKAWEKKILEETGGRRNFHVLKFPKDADYINMLHDWAMSADGEGSGNYSELNKRRMSGVSEEHERNLQLDGDTLRIGKEPPYWGEMDYWTRERFPAIKNAFQACGEERHFKRTLEDVGFSYANWKREKAEEPRKLV